ncbi:MAG: type III-B CRISPR module RAMP protein Cmr4, partial [candidate division WOR-3 bacterium]
FEAKYGNNDEKVKHIFGPDFGRGDAEAFAGAAAFTDARLLLFPVRCLNGVFAYTTSRLALNRLKKDLVLSGFEASPWQAPADAADAALGVQGSKVTYQTKKVVLEEYSFDFRVDNQVGAIAEWLASNALPQGEEYGFWRDKVKTDLILLPDDAFREFVRHSTEVQARVRIDNGKKTVDKGALFYEEALPSDTLLYSVVMAHDPARDADRRPEGLKTHEDVMRMVAEIDGRRLQFGGDATIGRGIINVRFLNGGK